jgi:PPOX class probable F420-dependent enzyme
VVSVDWQGEVDMVDQLYGFLRANAGVNKIPSNFLDLINYPPVAVLTTLMPDGRPQTTVVWCDFDDIYVRVNTMRGFRKEKNMRANPKVTLLCFDPLEPLRSLEVRGRVVEMTEEGAMEHLDRLAKRYTGAEPYFGACVPAELKEKEIPVLCNILPIHVVTLDARKRGENI